MILSKQGITHLLDYICGGKKDAVNELITYVNEEIHKLIFTKTTTSLQGSIAEMIVLQYIVYEHFTYLVE